MKLEDSRRVLITGGSRGIGAAAVRQFAAAGHAVAFTYLTSEKEAAELARETGAVMIRADCRSEEDAFRAVSDAERALGGPIEVLVNNAGISRSGLLTDLSLKEWNEILAVNLTGAFLFSRAVIPGMVRQRYGRILQISSIWGMVGASCEVAYSASKAGLLGFTKALAKELGPSGITVNAIAPGVIDTKMNAALGEDTLAELAEETPLCRIGTPEEIASSILFLAGSGGDFITGQVLSPNGGFVVC